MVGAKFGQDVAETMGLTESCMQSFASASVTHRGPVVCWRQGDQIGRIFAQFAQRVIVYFGQWFEIDRSSVHFWATFVSRY
jgi:hypothetical protein